MLPVLIFDAKNLCPFAQSLIHIVNNKFNISTCDIELQKVPIKGD